MDDKDSRVENRIRDYLEQAKSVWNNADAPARKRILLGIGVLICAGGFPLLSSSSPCSSSDTYQTAEQIYGRFFAVTSIGDAQEIGNDRETATLTCRASLTLRNGERQSIKYTIRNIDDGTVWIEAQQAN